MKILLCVFIVLTVIFLYIRFLESSSIFYPSRFLISTPEAIGIPFEDVYFPTEDKLTLNGWFIQGISSLGEDAPLVMAGQTLAPGQKEKANAIRQCTLLFFHGNAGNIGDRLGRIELFFHMGFKNIFIVDYRGYGRSQGRPSEEGIYKDALAAYDYLLTRSDVDREHIIVYGASLGGAAAVDLASKRRLGALIVDSSFTNAADMAKIYYPFIPAFLIQTKLDSLAKIKSIAVPKLFIHSLDDETVPISLGRKLYEAACGPKEFLQITGGHNEAHIFDQEKYVTQIKNFIKNDFDLKKE